MSIAPHIRSSLVVLLVACGAAPEPSAGGGGAGGSGGNGDSGGGGAASAMGGGQAAGGGGMEAVGGGTQSAVGGGVQAAGGGQQAMGGGMQAAGGGSAPGYPPLTSAEQQVLMQRPYRVVVPASYDGSKPVPFLLLLHGYTLDGQGIDTYFGMSALAQSKGFILATPDGEKDILGLRYWNATDYCCGEIVPRADDVDYLAAILDDVRLKYNIDPKRVFVSGHSNGGFMSHRMACDHADRIAAIASFAGAQWKDVSHCHPSEKVAVLEVHGDNDGIVSYSGTVSYPGAVETTNDWSTLNGCSGTKTSAGADADLTPDVAGSETKRQRFTGCPAGNDVELWTMQGGSHVPTLYTAFASSLWDFLLAHPKP